MTDKIPVSLDYKKPFSAKFYKWLIALLFLNGLVAFLFFTPYEPFTTAETTTISDGQGTRTMTDIIYHTKGSTKSPAIKVMIVFGYIGMFLLLFSFYFNVSYYPRFIRKKIRFIKEEFGLPIEMAKFEKVTEISGDWLREHSLRFAEIDEYKLKLIIIEWNKGLGKLYRHMAWWPLKLLDAVFDPRHYFKESQKIRD